MVVVWLAAATLTSGIVELVATVFSFRATHLWEWLEGLLAKDSPSPPATGAAGAASLATVTPTVSAGASSGYTAFIEALPGVTSTALKKVRAINAAAAVEALVIANRAEDFGQTQLGTLLRKLPADIRDNEERLGAWLQKWFDAEMARISQAYKSRIRWWTALFGLVVAGGALINSIDLATRFYQSPSERAVVIAAAAVPATTTTATGPTTTTVNPPTTSECPLSNTDASQGTPQTELGKHLKCVRQDADKLFALKVSAWQHLPKTCWAWGRLALGVLLTWAAVAAGAPFWFAVLKRMMSVRSRGESSSS